jgi:hypothetical protein
MPAWLIEIFAEARLTLLFWVTTLLPVPLWLLMIFMPRAPATRLLANPFWYPLLLCPAVAFLYYLLLTVSLPEVPDGLRFADARALLAHPIVFLIVWTKLQVLHLFLGATLYHHANRQGLRTPVVLLLTWLTGPVGLLVYALRLLVHTLRRGGSIRAAYRF